MKRRTIIILALALTGCAQVPVCGSAIVLPAAYARTVDCSEWERGLEFYEYRRPTEVRFVD